MHPATYRALYQVLRIPRTWRWRNTYGWLTIPDSYTYTAEDQPGRTAAVLRDWMHTVPSGSAPTRSG